MTPSENTVRAIRFERPEWIPMSFKINAACWNHYDPEALQDLMEGHPLLFPGYIRQPVVRPSLALTQFKDRPYCDPWGCVWETAEDGITGTVHGHPLEDWSALDSLSIPDPERTDGTLPVDWAVLRADAEKRRARGDLVSGGLPHGHTFLRLQDMRGYQNVLFDMLDDEPKLARLISRITEFNEQVVRHWLALSPDLMRYPEDLGMQSGPMLSPELFRKYIQPVYRRLMQPAREKGCIVHMHSDGDIRLLADDLVDGGVEVINLQDLVNGIDWIRERFAGRVCIDLDVDRQSVTARGTPGDIDRLIREEVEKLGSPQGGLMLLYGLYPGVPLENAAALMDALERYAGYYS
ncbi:MAG: uroporphyrinogen decarboxylase family protein [Kiritimatiellia bacterium]|nr:uroporphyrinogen decarboxylase family protein [Kiritimatiellia bacterium]